MGRIRWNIVCAISLYTNRTVHLHDVRCFGVRRLATDSNGRGAQAVRPVIKAILVRTSAEMNGESTCSARASLHPAS